MIVRVRLLAFSVKISINYSITEHRLVGGTYKQPSASYTSRSCSYDLFRLCWPSPNRNVIVAVSGVDDADLLGRRDIDIGFEMFRSRVSSCAWAPKSDRTWERQGRKSVFVREITGPGHSENCGRWKRHGSRVVTKSRN